MLFLNFKKQWAKFNFSNFSKFLTNKKEDFYKKALFFRLNSQFFLFFQKNIEFSGELLICLFSQYYHLLQMNRNKFRKQD